MNIYLSSDSISDPFSSSNLGGSPFQPQKNGLKKSQMPRYICFNMNGINIGKVIAVLNPFLLQNWILVAAAGGETTPKISRHPKSLCFFLC